MGINNTIHVAVTGAYGYSGQYIARRSLARGFKVRTLTNSPNRHSTLHDKIETHRLEFENQRELTNALRGVDTLINTYWVRFNRAGYQHSVAVENTTRLFAAAQEAGVRRIVHVSITNPSEDSPLEYFSGKAKLERVLIESGISHAILRPTVLFGKEDILINNIAWMLRRFPVFGVFGDGEYRLQPVYVDDLAGLAVSECESDTDVIHDAIGPETFTYRSLVETIGSAIGKSRPIIKLPPGIGACLGSVMGRFLGDVVITREEIEGLMAGLLYTDSKPICPTRFSDWLVENADSLGRRYANELKRRRDRTAGYQPA